MVLQRTLMRMEVSKECTLLVAVTLTATITGLFAQYGAAEGH